MKFKPYSIGTGVVIGALTVLAIPAQAADFYSGKTIRLSDVSTLGTI